ncbi:MAG: 8-amino-7-oxononanoate synthase [Elusimicrobia bacterium]|nr:8-amino-7-oxononanoate synthase [Candidatus Obscuribacterium magneticum]
MFADEIKNELDELESSGLKRTLFDVDGFKGVNFSSNDYLGLANHPAVKMAAVEATDKYGAGGASSRSLAGTRLIHRELEEKLARYFQKEAALVFSSGYHANTGLIPVLAGSSDIIFVDRLCHASLLDGVRLSAARFSTFEHNDIGDLESQLTKKRSQYKKALIITEGVFSMDGDMPPLREMVSLAKRHQAILYLDEAHSVGVFGPEGRGVAAQMGVLDQIDVFVGTLSKAFGSQGAFVVSGRSFIDLAISRCRSFMYTTALAPGCVGAALASLKLFPEMTPRRDAILKAAETVKNHLQKEGYLLLSTQSQIVPVWTGDVEFTKKLSDHLFASGFFVPSIRPPTVPAGEGRVRLSLTYDAIKTGVDGLLSAFTVFKERPKKRGNPFVQEI